MTQIKSLKGISLDELYKSFENAFSDYEVQITKPQLEALLIRRGYYSELSFGAFSKNKLVAFTFNGIGEFNGISTAYNTGTGTTIEFRRKGLAKQIFLHSLPLLREAGISQYLLEVLRNNDGAISLYKKLGSKITREFNYCISQIKEINPYNKPLANNYIIQQDIEISKEIMNQFWDFNPAWQNSFESISRKREAFKILGIYFNDTLVGYAILEPSTGDLCQLAVDKNYRRKGIASNLFKEVLKLNQTNVLKIMNIEKNCNSTNGFLKRNSITPIGGQYEMILGL